MYLLVSYPKERRSLGPLYDDTDRVFDVGMESWEAGQMGFVRGRQRLAQMAIKLRIRNVDDGPGLTRLSVPSSNVEGSFRLNAREGGHDEETPSLMYRLTEDRQSSWNDVPPSAASSRRRLP